MFTRFMDMSSGGRNKEDFDFCFIEAPMQDAKVIFYNRFGHDPERVTCSCCGEDYSITEHDSLEQATAYDRKCKFVRESNSYIEEDCEYGKRIDLSDYLKQKRILVIYEKDIKPEERVGEIRKSGYVWVD